MTLGEHCPSSPGDEEMSMGRLRTGDSQHKGPEVEFCLVHPKNEGVGKMEWRERRVGGENTQKALREPDCVRLCRLR